MTIFGPGGVSLENEAPFLRWLREHRTEADAALIFKFVWEQVLVDPFVGQPLTESVPYIRRAHVEGTADDLWVVWGVGESDHGPFVEVIAPCIDEEP